MIPVTDINAESLQEYIYPSRTYQIDVENKRITGMTDGISAIRQAIHKIIQTERYADLIYTWNYGSELEQFVGQDFDYVKAAAEGKIRDALVADDRITGIRDLTITKQGIDSCLISFIVESTEGDAQVEEVLPI